jgi:hypothetical protein
VKSFGLGKGYSSMIEHLKTLLDHGLLTPISTIFTGVIAVIAVLINNTYIRHNLNKQLDASSNEVNNKLVNDSLIVTRKNKQEKMEQLHENLDLYLNALRNNFNEAYFILLSRKSISELPYSKLNETRETYLKAQPLVKKVFILGYSYADTEDLIGYLDELKNLNLEYQTFIHKIIAKIDKKNISASGNQEETLSRATEGEKDKELLEKLAELITIFTNISIASEKISDSIINEIRMLRDVKHASE